MSNWDIIRSKKYKSAVAKLCQTVAQEAFDYILNAAGVQTVPTTTASASVDELKEKLMHVVREFFRKNDVSVIYQIKSISTAIRRTVSTDDNGTPPSTKAFYQPAISAQDKLNDLLEYCRTKGLHVEKKNVFIKESILLINKLPEILSLIS